MTRRLLVSYLTVTLVVLLLLELPLAAFYSQRESERFTADIERDATVLASLYEDDLESAAPLESAAADRYRVRTGARVVIVDAAGITLVDTEQSVPRDFSTRPEIAAALTGDRSAGTRHSDTLDTDLVYVAVPIASGGTVHGALRLTLDAARVDDRIHRFWLGLGAIGVIVLAAMGLVGWLIARSVSWPLRRLDEAAARFASGDLSAPETLSDGPTELRRLGATMADMATRLSAMLDEQRAFVADASHQLRTPLTALRLRLENVQTRVDDDVADELDHAIDETDRLSQLVTDLLQLARADAPRESIQVDLSTLVTERVEMWTAMAELHDITLRFDGPAAPCPAAAVPGAIEQILDNVIDNALNASAPGTTVTVELLAATGADGPSIGVLDEGPGLTDDDKDKALRRFWRGTGTTPGSGLGLAIAGALAASCGGRIELSDHVPRGLAVHVRLRSPGHDRP